MLPPPVGQALQTTGLWDSAKEFILLFAGIHIFLLLAIAGGALVQWAGGNPVAGYAAVWLIIYVALIRPRL
jgi:hypothetical protein